MFEKDLPGRSTKSFATSADDIGNLPLEVCETINGSWGFNLKDRKHKSKKDLVQYLIKAAGYDSNLLLNVGPMPNGKIQKEHIKSLKEIGDWVKINGETIYGTSRGPINPTDEIASTQKDKTIYIHLLDNRKTYFVEGYSPKIKKISYYHSGKKVKYQKTKSGLIINVDDSELDEIDTIIELKI